MFPVESVLLTGYIVHFSSFQAHLLHNITDLQLLFQGTHIIYIINVEDHRMFLISDD